MTDAPTKEAVAAAKAEADQCTMQGHTVSATTRNAAITLRDALTASEAWEVHLPENLHPDTASLVRRFAVALGEKLYRSQEKYGYGASWSETDWQEKCRADLEHHVAKGDPLDVAAYAAFSWHHGWATGLPGSEAQAAAKDARIAELEGLLSGTSSQDDLIARLRDARRWFNAPLMDAAAARLSTLEAENAKLREAVKKAREFIENGVEAGYIHIPPNDTAEQTLPAIRAALALP